MQKYALPTLLMVPGVASVTPRQNLAMSQVVTSLSRSWSPVVQCHSDWMVTVTPGRSRPGSPAAVPARGPAVGRAAQLPMRLSCRGPLGRTLTQRDSDSEAGTMNTVTSRTPAAWAQLAGPAVTFDELEFSAVSVIASGESVGPRLAAGVNQSRLGLGAGRAGPGLTSRSRCLL